MISAGAVRAFAISGARNGVQALPVQLLPFPNDQVALTAGGNSPAKVLVRLFFHAKKKNPKAFSSFCLFGSTTWQLEISYFLSIPQRIGAEVSALGSQPEGP